MLAIILAGHGLARLGIDAEWVGGSSCGGGSLSVQWLQLGCRGEAWLLDLPTLTATPSSAAHLQAALGALFASPRLLKVGFGLAADLRVVRSAHGSLRCCCAPSAVSPSVDLVNEWRKLRGAGAVSSLSALCATVLGAPLDKRCCLSNWGRRPLAAQQLEYAALDALVLPTAHEELERRRIRAGGAPAGTGLAAHCFCACLAKPVARAALAEGERVVRVELRLGRTFAPIGEGEPFARGTVRVLWPGVHL
mmetsp:Transcript_27850/g.89419  ORF Transcript_27850/g.89419 Transcript_27850/m.89419 type:complete len:250 (+) Transcript_27850:487-1236(+)